MPITIHAIMNSSLFDIIHLADPLYIEGSQVIELIYNFIYFSENLYCPG